MLTFPGGTAAAAPLHTGDVVTTCTVGDSVRYVVNVYFGLHMLELIIFYYQHWFNTSGDGRSIISCVVTVTWRTVVLLVCNNVGGKFIVFTQ